MLAQVHPVLLALVVTSLVAQLSLAGQTCNVSNAYDLQHGLSRACDCSTLELQHDISLTSLSFSALTVNSQSLTIQSSETAPDAVLDFGSYTLNGKVLVTGTSNITFRDITLQGYASNTVQNGTLDTFLPLFNVETTSSIYMSNVSFLMESGRCSLAPRYAPELATPRTSWLQSIGLAGFQGGADNSGVYYVQHAKAPLRFDRENVTTALPAQDTANITFDNCSFACPTLTEPLPAYAIISRAWGPLDLFRALRLEDSRLILLQQSLTTSNSSWGFTPVLIASSRVVYIVGSPNATVVQQGIAAFAASNSSTPAASPSIAAAEYCPDSFVTWSMDASTDLLQVGYHGSLVVEAVKLQLPQPSFVTLPPIGSWYFSNQPLPWDIFGTVLPGAFSVQAVREAQLNAPAYLVLRNVSIEYASCDNSFTAAAELLVSKANAQSEGAGQRGISFANQTITCHSCVFQGSEQIPSAYDNRVSQVELYDTNISCLNTALKNASANGTVAPAQNTTTAATAEASWAPPVWLPILLTLLTCVFVALGLLAVWHYIRKQREAAHFLSLQEAKHAHLSSPSNGYCTPASCGDAPRIRSTLPQLSCMSQVQKSKLSTLCPSSLRS